MTAACSAQQGAQPYNGNPTSLGAQRNAPISTSVCAHTSSSADAAVNGGIGFFKTVESSACSVANHGVKPKTPPIQAGMGAATKTPPAEGHHHLNASTSGSSQLAHCPVGIAAERQTRSAAAYDSLCLASPPPPPPAVPQRAVGSRSGSASSVSSASAKQRSPSCLRSGGSPVSPCAVGSRPCSNSSAGSSNGTGRTSYSGGAVHSKRAYASKYTHGTTVVSTHSATTKAKSIVAPPPRHLRPSHRTAQQRDATTCDSTAKLSSVAQCSTIAPLPLKTAQEELVDVAWAHDLLPASPPAPHVASRPAAVQLGAQLLHRSAGGGGYFPSSVAMRRQIVGGSSSSDDDDDESDDDDDDDDGVAEQEAAPRLAYVEGDHLWSGLAETGSSALQAPPAPSCFDSPPPSRGASVVHPASRPAAPTFPARYRRSVQSYCKQNQALHQSAVPSKRSHRFDADGSSSASDDG